MAEKLRNWLREWLAVPNDCVSQKAFNDLRGQVEALKSEVEALKASKQPKEPKRSFKAPSWKSIRQAVEAENRKAFAEQEKRDRDTDSDD